jgi:hypothetical protein
LVFLTKLARLAECWPQRDGLNLFTHLKTWKFMLLTDLITTLQLSIGPVILVSGVGLILLSMSNRFARVIDRTRLLSKDFNNVSKIDRIRIVEELKILSSRAKIVRAAIALAVLSVLLAALLVISLFLGALFKMGIAVYIVAIFILCMLSLVTSLLLFLADINLSLKALWLAIPSAVSSDAKIATHRLNS